MEHRHVSFCHTLGMGHHSAYLPLFGGLRFFKWVLEVAHVTDNIIFSYAIGSNVFGEIIQDGISLNKQLGYQETLASN